MSKNYFLFFSEKKTVRIWWEINREEREGKIERKFNREIFRRAKKEHLRDTLSHVLSRTCLYTLTMNCHLAAIFMVAVEREKKVKAVWGQKRGIFPSEEKRSFFPLLWIRCFKGHSKKCSSFVYTENFFSSLYLLSSPRFPVFFVCGKLCNRDWSAAWWRTLKSAAMCVC